MYSLLGCIAETCTTGNALVVGIPHRLGIEVAKELGPGKASN
ncbi:hypothetical protein [Olsenella sp. Marseille-P4559]|nr:hypothetical protein [Olsenella sp. Marseille-P4559]